MSTENIEHIRALLDDLATMRATNEALPLKYSFAINQYLQKLEDYLSTILSIEHKENPKKYKQWKK